MQGAQVWPLVRELRFPHAAWHSQKINKSFLKYNKIDTFGCGKPILKSYTAMYQFKFLQWFLLPGVWIWLSQVGSQVSLTSPEDSSPDSGPADSLATSQAWVAVTWLLPSLIFLLLSRVPFFLCSAYPNYTHPSLLSNPPSPGSCSRTPKVKQLASSSLDPYSFITTIHLERITFSLKFWSKYYVWFPKGERKKWKQGEGEGY